LNKWVGIQKAAAAAAV